MSSVGLELLAAAATGVAAAAAVYGIHPPRPSLAARVAPYSPETAPSAPRRPVRREWVRVVDRRADDVLEQRLLLARSPIETAADFRVQQATRGAVHAIAFGAVGVVSGLAPLWVVAFAAVGVAAGAARTRGALERAIAERAQRIRRELLVVVQLLALHLRTGAGVMAAIQRFVERSRGELADEFGRVLDAVRRGEREVVALRRAAASSPAPEFARTCHVLATGIERGTDLAPALLALATDLRASEREAIRRSATKRRAAMLVPTIALLAPVMLLFVAAPLPSIVLGNH